MHALLAQAVERAARAHIVSESAIEQHAELSRAARAAIRESRRQRVARKAFGNGQSDAEKPPTAG